MTEYIVIGEQTGILGTYKTLKAAKKAIKDVNKYDIEEIGEIDTYTIEESEN